MKKELIVSMLLVLAFLSFVNLFVLTPTVKAQPQVIGSTDIFGHSYQRYTFYANGRFWAFYSDNTNMVYKTSTDGSTWSDATMVRAAIMCPEFSVWFDGTYVHYAKSQKLHYTEVPNTPLYYRMGVPNANGTITWNANEQIVAPAVENRSYRAPQIITDSDGYPVITYLNRTTPGRPWDWSVCVSKSFTKNGTWTNATGFPVVISFASTDRGWPFSVPLTNGNLYTMWSLENGKIRGALYNGTYWESAENCTSDFIGEDQYGACAVAYGDDVNLVYIGNETATKIYRYVKRTYGSGWGNETVVKNVTGASGNLGSISLTVDPSNGDLWMWFNTTDNRIAYRKYVASTSNWAANDTYPFGDSFTSPYHITASYQVHNGTIPTYWQEGTTTPYDLVFDYLDTMPPDIEILSPEDKTYAVSDVPLSFTVSESTSWMGYSLDGQANVTVTGNTTLTSLLDGSHHVVVYANDTAGNMGYSSTVYFTVDTSSPTISVLSPENKTYAVSDVPLSFTVSESTSWMGYSLDGQANNTIAGNTTIVDLPDGIHTVIVYANDTTGNMGYSSTVYFTVDTTPPNITDVSQIPLENNVLPEDEVKVNATVTDELSGVKQVTLNYTNGDGTWVTVNMTNLEGNVWNATIPAFPYGTNVTYRIIAEDNMNNTITTEELGYEYQYIVVPEFAAWTPMLLILMALTVAIAICKRRLLKTRIH